MTLCVTSALVSGVVWASRDSDPPTVDAAHGTHAAGGEGAAGNAKGRAVTSERAAPQSSSPVRKLAIPAMVIEAPVISLGLDSKGRLGTPPLSRPKVVGWYRGGPVPGDMGTAVIVGHRDTRTGPAIFLNLNALNRGDAVNVVRSDHRTAVFTVDTVKTYKKEEFPSAKVYGATGRPELRLLTCGGSFDKKSGYSANVVVFAHLSNVRNT
ncbi:class F sortase [Streptomyces sp. NBC_00344]|uniref:class F sortase n=1 Tax=Streptomyces sp. NBC_00344 TaxID=2975720 RepID=UPI002E1A4E31